MPRKYIRKTNRQTWSGETMHRAVEEVVFGRMGARKASIQFGIPKATIERRVLLYRKGEDHLAKVMGSRRTVFTLDQEKMLVEYLQEMEARLFGLTKNDLAKLAFELAEANKVKHPFNDGQAGPDWVDGFLLRHKKQLSLRTPEGTSGARAMGFNKPAVTKFFNLYEEAIDSLKLSPNQIYNCDETGVTIVPKSQSKIISTKGKRQVGALTSAERGHIVTVELCLSASGEYMPPMFVFPRKRNKEELLLGAPPGSWAQCHTSGWMQKEIFFLWFKKFVQFSRASKDNPVLLLLDGHSTHIKSIELIDLARSNNVHILCFPPHCSHKIQPLDISFMRPLSLNYGLEVKNWLRSNAGLMVSQFQIAKLLGDSFIKAATMTTALNGFRKAGLWPVDRNIFCETDFLPSATTDIPISTEVSSQFTAGTTTDSDALSLTPKPGTSSPSVPFQFSPRDILPIPKSKGNEAANGRKKRKKGKTCMITASPYKNELAEEKEKQKQLEAEKAQKRVDAQKRRIAIQKRAIEKQRKKLEREENRKTAQEQKRLQKMKNLKRKLLFSSSTSDSDANITAGESSEDGEIIGDEKRTIGWRPLKKIVGEFVIFKYEEKYYPGVVKNVSTSTATISAMKAAGRLWKWPDRPDILDYSWEVVAGAIEEPRKTSKTRNVFSVPELNMFFE